MEEDANFALNFDSDVFESSFIYWSNLPAHLKVQILRNLPYPTLRSFMFLSKECMTLTSSVKTQAYGVYLQNDPFLGYSEYVESKEASATIIIYYIPPEAVGIPDSHKPYTLTFVDVEDGGCVVKRRKDKRGRSIVTNGVRYQNEKSASAAVRVFFQLTKNIKAQYLSIEMTSENAEIERVLESKTLAPSLLRFVSPGCGLNIYNLDPFSEEIFMDSAFCDSEAVRQAPEFDTEAMVAVSDDQLSLLRAHCLRIKAPYISSKGINKLIMQWLNNQRIIEEILLTDTQRVNEAEVFEGVDKDRILSDVEISKSPFIRERMENMRPGGSLHAGLRNFSGALILINIGTDFCDLINPHSEVLLYSTNMMLTRD
ncbi:unnamed protein product [Cylicocyclus nassatus]|uniref:F-box domain-containing protein n=1 Tax=Cylicocyclus nassatus TaxID=53992 RepID=A0AA36GLP9_CYLNA|nr:unnamed protein product [Cylicocyclus nassatus]